MSNTLAIAAVTATLRQLLHSALNADVPGTSVTTRPPDKARSGANGNQVNLFLYQTTVNAAWSNMDVPGRSRPGEHALPPLALDLRYLLTAYGAGDDDPDPLSHRLMGRAMSVLHDHPVLGAEEIRDAFPGNDLHLQVEHVRITPQPLSVDELSKLWSAFQSGYRLSAAYLAAAVLIDSTRAAPRPLPVLARGNRDRGVFGVASATPSLRELRFPHLKPSAELGDRITLVGDRLAGDDLVVRLHHQLIEDPIELPPVPDQSVAELHLRLPDAAVDAEVISKWPVGFWSLELVVRNPGLPTWTTNALPMALAPTVTGIDPSAAPEGNLTLTVTCSPQVRTGQRVVLLFGEREIALQSSVTPPGPSDPSRLTFAIAQASAGTHVVRLRIDGVDSIPVDFSSETPTFADSQKVTIT